MEEKKTPQEIIKERFKEKHKNLPLLPLLDIETVIEQGELYVIISKRVNGKMEYSVLKKESEFTPLIHGWIKDILQYEEERINEKIKDGEYDITISLFNSPFMVSVVVKGDTFSTPTITPIIQLSNKLYQ